MNKYPLIGASICAVVLLVLASFSSVIGYQTVRASNEKIITTEITEKELVFQTIIDTANNREIQKAFFGSQILGKRLFDSGIKLTAFPHPVVTKSFLNFAYHLGVLFSSTIGAAKLRAMLEPHRAQLSNRELEENLTAVVQKDGTLSAEWTHLTALGCGCEEDNNVSWKFPVVCTIMWMIFAPLAFLDAYVYFSPFGILWGVIYFLEMILELTAQSLRCWWE